tara:strand:+ start:894 stop:1199 length:306 start_codon:yes stop_codon:yes gene_type:complete
MTSTLYQDYKSVLQYTNQPHFSNGVGHWWCNQLLIKIYIMKEQVRITMDILSNWDCMNDLNESEKQYIEWQLNFIADQAIADYRKKINELGNELLLTNKNK